MTFDRRKNPRFSCPNPGVYYLKTEGADNLLWLSDFSRDGLSFQGPKEFKKDEVHQFDIHSPDFDRTLSCQARIVWVKPHDQGFACGAKIEKMAPSDKVSILEILYEAWKQKMLEKNKTTS